MRHPLKSITGNALVVLAAFGLLLNSSITFAQTSSGAPHGKTTAIQAKKPDGTWDGLNPTQQKILAPLIFSTVYSRLAFDPNNITLFFLNWLSVFYTSMPQLVIKSLKRVDLYGYVITLTLALALVSSWARQESTKLNTQARSKNDLGTLFVSLFCFFASSLIFILSGANAEISGYDARALSSTWICLSLLFASAINLFPKKIFCSQYFNI
jgi:hypothetical protein